MAMDTEAFQFAVTTCSEHPNEELFYHCSTCPQRICEKCVKGKHKEHEWTSIRNHARKVRQEGQKISERIRKEIIPSACSSKSSKRKDQREAQKKKVLGMQRRMTDLINSYTKYLLSLIDGQTADDAGDVSNEEHLLKLADFFERHVQIAHDNVVVEMEEVYRKTIEQHTQTTTKSSKEMVFNEGNLDEDVIKKMFGKVVVQQGKIKATHLNTFTFGTKNILGMVSTSSDRVWLHVFGSTKCTLVDENGKSVVEKDFGKEYNRVIIKDNAHIIADGHFKAITRYTDGKLHSLYSTSLLHPIAICESHGGGLLVSLVECGPSEITTTTKGEIHHIDMKGKIIRKYTIDERDQTRLFTFPNRVAINLNSDLCVVDVLNKDLSCRVITVTVDSKIRSTYKGHPRLGKKFTVSDITCDSVGRIILTDLFNSSIHILSADGDFLQFLLTADNGLARPQSITLNTDRLWVGCAKGVVKLYELNFP